MKLSREDLCYMIEKRATAIAVAAKLSLPDPVGTSTLAKEVMELVLQASEPQREPLDQKEPHE